MKNAREVCSRNLRKLGVDRKRRLCRQVGDSWPSFGLRMNGVVSLFKNYTLLVTAFWFGIPLVSRLSMSFARKWGTQRGRRPAVIACLIAGCLHVGCRDMTFTIQTGSSLEFGTILEYVQKLPWAGY
jgi:hypothetical protein